MRTRRSEERLERLVADLAHLPPAALRDAILEDVESFTRDAPQSDDVTLVIVKREG